uniref:Neur_chan_LBD domain-containing protein n=1 Tax=Globodera pallida TaxID=36090 RepID=A0A183CGE8_GLOPA
MSSHKHLLILFEVLAFCTFLWGRSLRERLQRNPKLPPLVGNEPLKVFCGIYIESLGNFRAAEMSFDADLYLYLSWQDPSLNHSDFDYVLLNDPKIRHYIWLPDLYFANSRTSRFHEVIAPNLNLFIDRNGTIAYSTRITLSVACNLELSLYPMDSQKCAIQMLSYAYVENQVSFSWFDIIDATRYNPDIQLPEFKIVNLTNEYCDGIYNYAIMEHSFKRDKFSCLEAIIHLNRQIGYHVVQSFIPTGMIVMISWVSFWIDRRAVPARVTLSFTTLLSLSTLGNGLRFGLPQVAYAKAIDFWFGACMFFVFLSLLEFAAVNSYMREAEKYERFANYYAKKNSVTIPPGRAPPKGGPSPMISRIPTPLPQRGPMFFDSSTQNSWERAKPAIIDYNKLPSIDASSSESDESPTLKWSSAANVGENNPVWFSVDEQPPQRSPPLKMKKEEKKEFAKISRVLPAITVDRTESGRKKHINNNNASSASSKTQPPRDVNPMATNHFLHEGFRCSRKGLSIDLNSRWLFPTAFTIWNLLYWGYYLWYIQPPTKSISF